MGVEATQRWKGTNGMHGREATNVWTVMHERDDNMKMNAWEQGNNRGGVV